MSVLSLSYEGELSPVLPLMWANFDLAIDRFPSSTSLKMLLKKILLVGPNRSDCFPPYRTAVAYIGADGGG